MISKYCLLSPEYSRPVEEVMALFGIQQIPALRVDSEHYPLVTKGQIAVKIVEERNAGQWQIIILLYCWNGNHPDLLQAAEELREEEITRGEINRIIRISLWELLQKITGFYPGSWGILRGVRPVKIAHRLLDSGMALDDTSRTIQRRYGVERNKADLVTTIALKQRPFLAPLGELSRTVSIYIAIPYCPTRCLYCSFPANLLPKERLDLLPFLVSLYADMADVQQAVDRYGLNVQTVYIGGGTPTSLSDDDFSALLAVVRDLFITKFTKEFTVEAGRPDTLTAAKLSAINNMGVTRVSVNPQTMNENTLCRLRRHHTVQQVIDVFHQFRENKTLSINMDVIAGLPGESEQDMIETMDKIASLAPDNLTVHTLALKRGSELIGSIAGYPLPDERTTRRMVEIAACGAKEIGLEPYYLYRQKYMTGNLENVGYALPGREGLYNMQIMEERQTILGIGPAAGTKVVDGRTFQLKSSYNAKDIHHYCANLPVYLRERNSLLAELYGSD